MSAVLTESTAAALLANFDVARAELAEHAEVARAELAELADGALVRRSSAPCARASVELPRCALAGRVVDLPHRLSRGPKPQPGAVVNASGSAHACPSLAKPASKTNQCTP